MFVRACVRACVRVPRSYIIVKVGAVSKKKGKKKGAAKKSDPAAAAKLVEQGFQLMQKNPQDEKGPLKLFEEALKQDPWCSNALAQLGMRKMGMPEPYKTQAFNRIAKAFDSRCNPEPINPDSPQGFFLATMVGRFRLEQKEYLLARPFLEKAAVSQSRNSHCGQIMMASQLTPYAQSSEDARAGEASIQNYNRAPFFSKWHKIWI